MFMSTFGIYVSGIEARKLKSSKIKPNARLSQEISRKIRTRIMHGGLRPGDKLSSERELADEIGVGRPVIREAFRSLEAAGILEFRAGKQGGAFVKAANAESIVQSVNDVIFLGGASLKEITELRLCVLVFAIDVACRRGTAKQFDEIDANITYTETLLNRGDDELALAAILDFYTLLGRASRNEMLAMLIEALSSVVWKILLKVRPKFMRTTFIETRRGIALNLRKRDPVAARGLLEAHLIVLHKIVETSAAKLHELRLNPN